MKKQLKAGTLIVVDNSYVQWDHTGSRPKGQLYSQDAVIVINDTSFNHASYHSCRYIRILSRLGVGLILVDDADVSLLLERS